MTKLTKTSPPKVYWVDIDEQKPKWGTYLLFGVVNVGSPHESFSTFQGRYEPDLDKFIDSHGEIIDHKVT